MRHDQNFPWKRVTRYYKGKRSEIGLRNKFIISIFQNFQKLFSSILATAGRYSLSYCLSSCRLTMVSSWQWWWQPLWMMMPLLTHFIIVGRQTSEDEHWQWWCSWLLVLWNHHNDGKFCNPRLWKHAGNCWSDGHFQNLSSSTPGVDTPSSFLVISAFAPCRHLLAQTIDHRCCCLTGAT